MATAAGTYVGLVTIPAMMHPYIADGFRAELGPIEVSMLIGGFGLFAAGMAARSMVGLPVRERPQWLVRLSVLLRLSILGSYCSPRSKNLPSSTQLEPGLPPLVGRVLDGLGGINVRLWGWVPDPIKEDVQQWFAPDQLIWILTLLGLTMLVIEVVLMSNTQQTSPFDAVAESPAQAVRFLWLTVGLTVVCLAAVPIFIVGGQTLLHLQLRGADFPSSAGRVSSERLNRRRDQINWDLRYGGDSQNREPDHTMRSTWRFVAPLHRVAGDRHGASSDGALAQRVGLSRALFRA